MYVADVQKKYIELWNKLYVEDETVSPDYFSPKVVVEEVFEVTEAGETKQENCNDLTSFIETAHKIAKSTTCIISQRFEYDVDMKASHRWWSYSATYTDKRVVQELIPIVNRPQFNIKQKEMISEGTLTFTFVRKGNSFTTNEIIGVSHKGVRTVRYLTIEEEDALSAKAFYVTCR